MNLCWILSERPESREGRPFAVNGSDRLRCLEPAAVLGAQGHRVVVMPAALLPAKLDAPSLRGADAVIVAKQFADVTPLVRAVKERGPLVVVDVCDDVFRLDHLRQGYAGLLELADACTAASPVLAERLRARLDVPVAVVPDCVEGEASAPAFAPEPGEPLRLLWFGQPANLDALEAALPELGRFGRGVPLALTIVTRLLPQVTGHFPAERDGLPIRCLPWSPDTMRDALRDCHLVIVPSFPAEEKQAKSANRVATALWAGRLPVAFPLPSYRPFASSAILSGRLADGIAEALAQRAAVPARIAEGQALIRAHFTPAAVAERWRAVLTGFLNPGPAKHASHPGPEMG